MKPVEKVQERLVSWLREKVQAAGARGAVLGLSGGLDSAVVAVLGRQALGANMLALIMPCESLPEDEEHAQMLVQEFSLPYCRVPLDEPFEAMSQGLAAVLDGSVPGGAIRANLKPRLRMVTLYAAAAHRHYLVLGTGNRSELEMGYFTKHGDGGADLLPLGSLLKTQVRELARHLAIPRLIIEKAPSAGLWKGQTDEEEMGVAYEDIDAYLRGEEVDAEAAAIVEAARRQSAHKRRLPPIPVL